MPHGDVKALFNTIDNSPTQKDETGNRGKRSYSMKNVPSLP